MCDKPNSQSRLNLELGTSDVHDSIVPSDNVINENESNNEAVTKTIDNPIRLRRSGRDRTPTVLYPLPDRTSSNSGYQ